MSGDDKPNVLILGGTATFSRSLTRLLLPDNGECLVNYLRLADKYSVNPPTTYLGAEFPKHLTMPNVEYIQVNLTVPEHVTNTFEPPEGQKPFDYIFDLTGEIRRDRPSAIIIHHTHRVIKLIGLEAARRKVKAFVRFQPPFYETPEKGNHDESEIIKPDGKQAVIWHEALRIAASIPDLNLVIVRGGLIYGPYIEGGQVSKLLVVAATYGYAKKPMKSLWPPGNNPMYTMHSDDLAGAMWACAIWMSSLGRKEADRIAGEEIQPNENGKLKDMEDATDPTKKLVAPLFNIVDDSKSTLLSIGTTITSVFGISFGFEGFVTNTLAKILPEPVFQEINDVHLNLWTEMITSSNPPILNTPLTAFLDEYMLRKAVFAFNNEKIKKIVGYKLKHPTFEKAELEDIIEKWKKEGSWPILDYK